jgi:hypothetical protein
MVHLYGRNETGVKDVPVLLFSRQVEVFGGGLHVLVTATAEVHE